MTPKKDLMKRLRDERKAQGLVELRLWLTPEQREKVEKYAKVLTRRKA